MSWRYFYPDTPNRKSNYTAVLPLKDFAVEKHGLAMLGDAAVSLLDLLYFLRQWGNWQKDSDHLNRTVIHSSKTRSCHHKIAQRPTFHSKPTAWHQPILLALRVT